MQFLRTESYKKGVLFSTALNILAKGTTFLNTLIIAYYFGANITTDIYFGVISVALIITTTINGIDFLILIPEVMRLREQAGEKASQRFANFFLYCYAGIGVFFASVIVIAPAFFYSLFTSFEPNSLLQHRRVLYISGLVIFFQLINNLLGAILSSYKFFTIAILTGLVNSTFTITLTIIFHETLGIEGTIAGLAIGGLINFLLLISVLLKYQHWNFSNVGWVRDKTVWTNILLMQINILPLWLRNSIGLYLLSGLGTGTVTSLSLGQQLAAIPDILIVTQLLSVAGIKFAELFSQKNSVGASGFFLRLSEWGIYITSFIGFGFFLFSTEIVRVFYARSNIGENGLLNIETAFCFFIFCLPTKFNAALCTSILTASQNIRSTFVVSFITHTVVTVSMVLLITNFGLVGYLIGINMHYYIFLLIFYPVIRKVLPYINYAKVFTFFALNALNNGLAFVAVFCLFNYKIIDISNVYIKLVTGFTLYTIFVIVCNEFTKANRHLTIKQLYIYGNKRFSS
jgi:peptidoglycan biosynthesis protein MviN/MurJ (putative lipid II flippase)